MVGEHAVEDGNGSTARCLGSGAEEERRELEEKKAELVEWALALRQVVRGMGRRR